MRIRHIETHLYGIGGGTVVILCSHRLINMLSVGITLYSDNKVYLAKRCVVFCSDIQCDQVSLSMMYIMNNITTPTCNKLINQQHIVEPGASTGGFPAE